MEIERRPPSEVAETTSKEIAFTEIEQRRTEEAMTALGMKELTTAKLRQYHHAGGMIQRVGALKIGRTSLMQCIEGTNKNIERLSEMLETYAKKTGNVEVDRMKADIMDQLSKAYQELARLGVEMVRSSSIDLTDEAVAPAVKPFAPGQPVVFAQHATVNQQARKETRGVNGKVDVDQNDEVNDSDSA